MKRKSQSRKKLNAKPRVVRSNDGIDLNKMTVREELAYLKKWRLNNW
jgi:hypothetical protein